MDADEDGDGGGWDVDDDLELPPDLVSNIIVQDGKSAIVPIFYVL